MLYRKNNEWAFCPHKVIYTQHGEALEAFTHDKEWWQNFAKQWDRTEIVEFVDVAPTLEQTARLDKVKHMGEGHGEACRIYVETGEFPAGHDLGALLNLGKVKPDLIPEEYQLREGAGE